MLGGGKEGGIKNDLFIKSPAQKVKTKIINNKSDSLVLQLVNGVSSVPYKINCTVLDFLLDSNNSEFLTSPIIYDAKIYSSLTKLRKDDIKLYKEVLSNKSVINLEQQIINIASLFRDITTLYFPDTLDSKGRLYCIPNYLNYQAHGLARALLLFSLPSKLHFHDTTSINYFKTFGANSFGGPISKQSIEKKDWVG